MINLTPKKDSEIRKEGLRLHVNGGGSLNQTEWARIALTYNVSLIAGWTVYTEKYKARGLYERPRDLYFSYRQSNQLLRSLLPD